ncbi:MAG TPA: hypothetical protein VJK03_02455 [Candidatus Nanoarchaeia archaeon]|nr:hypothetical protein [Candidatus Nanoarchaeia archaeon]
MEIESPRQHSFAIVSYPLCGACYFKNEKSAARLKIKQYRKLVRSMHALSHTNIKPFPCIFCSKETTAECSRHFTLSTHRTGEKVQRHLESCTEMFNFRHALKSPAR